MKQSRLFSSESVTSGHPDKVCDQISDAILDAALEQDPKTRAAVETLTTTDRVIVAGEATTTADLDIEQIVRDTVARIGYTEPGVGFDAETLQVQPMIDQQSPDIAQSVDRSFEMREESSEDKLSAQGAGDQGLMFGFACTDTPELMPLPIAAAHELARSLEKVRRTQMPQLRPDGKTQVSVRFEQKRPVSIETVLVSTQHSEDISLEEIREGVSQLVIKPVMDRLGESFDTSSTNLLINPSGRFVVGGPAGDTGVTGRKIIVDTYGGFSRHGGGAFSGKDASKVDRSASYAMRWIAKNVVAAGLATHCEVQVSYAIGRAEPVGLYVDTFGTGVVPDAELQRVIGEVFDLRPAAIIRDLHLTEPIFEPTAAYGHFGRDEFTWEQTDRVDELKSALA
ncbi:MAG: methionine adenosyltransferase [Actinomycetaceae bacterium]|nr:methionine adenosyltransferase [Actinomycetaceae bacterium]